MDVHPTSDQPTRDVERRRLPEDPEHVKRIAADQIADRQRRAADLNTMGAVGENVW